MSPSLGWGLALDNPGRTVTPGGNTWPGFATSAIGIGAGQTPVCFSPPVSCFVSLPPPIKIPKLLAATTPWPRSASLPLCKKANF